MFAFIRSVRKFAENFKKKDLPLNMLFNNAGEWIREDDTYTEDGFQVRLHGVSAVSAGHNFSHPLHGHHADTVFYGWTQ